MLIKFCKMDEDKLIILVQNNNLIYNKQNKDFKNVHKKKEAWASIGKELGLDATLCERRWTSLRERYSREIKLLEARSGSAAKEASNWAHFAAMSFLKDHLLRRMQRSSFTEHLNLSNCSTNSTQFYPISPVPETYSAVDFRFNFEEQSLEIIQPPQNNTLTQVNETFNKYVESAMAKTQDGRVSGFLTMASSILNSMGPTRKRRTIMRMMKILDEEESNVDEDFYITLP